ncbi:hypothetical protein Tco_1352879 [Tanacetum coccineum]
MKEKDVGDVVEEQILTIKLRAEDSSKKLMKYKLKITNSADVIVIKGDNRSKIDRLDVRDAHIDARDD